MISDDGDESNDVSAGDCKAYGGDRYLSIVHCGENGGGGRAMIVIITRKIIEIKIKTTVIARARLLR